MTNDVFDFDFDINGIVNAFVFTRILFVVVFTTCCIYSTIIWLDYTSSHSLTCTIKPNKQNTMKCITVENVGSNIHENAFHAPGVIVAAPDLQPVGVSGIIREYSELSHFYKSVFCDK